MVWQLIKGFMIWGTVAVVVQVLMVGLNHLAGVSRLFMLQLLYACIYTLVLLAASESGTDISSPLTMAPPAICLLIHMALNGCTFADFDESHSERKTSRRFPGL